MNLSGFTPNTVYALSIDSRYRGEAKVPGGYFSQFSSPTTVTTDGSGFATVTWIPDTFPQNFTASGESGYLLGSYVRVDADSGPQHDSSLSGFADPIALSPPLAIAFLAIADVSVTTPTCIEPEQLVSGQAGLPVTLVGLVPGEVIFVNSFQTGGPPSYGFEGSGFADATGSATIIVSGNTSEYPVSTSAAISPAQWQVQWHGSDRETPTAEHPLGYVPVTVGGCSGG